MWEPREYFTMMADILTGAQLPTRFSDEIDFAYSLPEGKWPEVGESGSEKESVERIAQEEARKLAEEVGPLPSGMELRGLPTGVGRGAEGWGFVLQLFGVTGTVTGAVLGVVESAKLVGRVWKRLFKKKSPMLSLGAIKMLCIADLAERKADLAGVELLFAGDVTQGPDASHTGLDLFLVMFVRQDPNVYGTGGDLWIYIVDAHGKLVHFATAWHTPFWTLADRSQEKSKFLLGAEEKGLEESP